MFFEDYKKAFDVLASIIDVSCLCLEKVVHSADGEYVIFITTCPDIRYLVRIKDGAVLKKQCVETGMFSFHDIVERLN